MIHLFPRFSKDAASTPYGDAVRASGAESQIHSAYAPQNYRSRLGLLLLGYPVLVWTACKTAWGSLVRYEGPSPDAVVISSDVEALVFALVRRWPGAAQARIVFIPFIFTSRASGAVNRLRLLYYRFVMRRVSLAICHSAPEVPRYERMFAGCGTEFVFVRWGAHVHPASHVLAHGGPLPAEERPVVASAGRSGRDYPTLVAAMDGLPCRTVIVCNDTASLAGLAEGPALEVLRNCFGTDYLWQLLRAAVVVVPLKVGDISAGQMVFIQAMALGRPLVVTATPTVGDYLVDGVNALLVPLGDVAALRAAVERLLHDPALAAALGRQARLDYERLLSGDVHFRDLSASIERHCGINTMGRPAG
ncbi:MAG: glycosyltransferase family 4 protein [Janthinobacterium lividum]